MPIADNLRVGKNRYVRGREALKPKRNRNLLPTRSALEVVWATEMYTRFDHVEKCKGRPTMSSQPSELFVSAPAPCNCRPSTKSLTFSSGISQGLITGALPSGK